MDQGAFHVALTSQGHKKADVSQHQLSDSELIVGPSDDSKSKLLPHCFISKPDEQE